MGNDPEREKLASLTERIQQAEAKPKASGAEDAPMKGSRIGLDFIGTILICTFLGWLLDRSFGIKPWGLIVMMFMGFAVSFLNMWRALDGSKKE